jgi:peptide/nickel transport system ATP-binding protein
MVHSRGDTVSGGNGEPPIQPVLRIDGLTTQYVKPDRTLRALDGISLEIAAGETLAVVGESGSGKTALGLSIMRLLPRPAGRIAAGRMLFDGEDLAALDEKALRAVRGNRISMIFQEPMTALNPVLTIERQIGEVMRAHRGSSTSQARSLALKMLRLVRIPDAERTLQSYPHQLSGGMRQRVMIAAALACQPALLIADEPTTALDVTIQAEILELIKELQSEMGTAVLFISHDLGVVSGIADHVMVLYGGRKVEQAATQALFARPLHPYTRALLAALPDAGAQTGMGNRRLPELPGSAFDAHSVATGCSFAPRCALATARCHQESPPMIEAARGHSVACWNWEQDALQVAPPSPGSTTVRVQGLPPVLEVRELGVDYHSSRLWRRSMVLSAVQDVSFEIAQGEALALVGESGCGKSSVARALLGLVAPSRGSITVRGADGERIPGGTTSARRHAQIVFQDPFSSLNPRMRIGDALAEPLANYRLSPALRRAERVRELLEQVGLRSSDSSKYPHEFSGGQRQRIAVARALAAEPTLIVCDEPTSALDVSIQAQVLNLLAEIQERRGLAYLFISHDLALVRHFTHRVAVMYLGRIVELAPVGQIFERPLHPYTVALLAAAPRVRSHTQAVEVHRLHGEPPSPAHPPSGCAFHTRCPRAIADCKTTRPALRPMGVNRLVACHVAAST